MAYIVLSYQISTKLYQEPPEFIQKLTRRFYHPPVMFSIYVCHLQNVDAG